jgi:hypothetical protein
MVQILVEQVHLEFPTEQQHREIVLHKLVILDIILKMENLKVTLTHGVRLLVVVVEQLKLIPQFLLQVQQAQVVLQKQVSDQHQLLHR